MLKQKSRKSHKSKREARKAFLQDRKQLKHLRSIKQNRHRKKNWKSAGRSISHGSRNIHSSNGFSCRNCNLLFARKNRKLLVKLRLKLRRLTSHRQKSERLQLKR